MSYNKEIESYGYKVIDDIEVVRSNVKFNCQDNLGYKYFIPYDRLRANKKPLPFYASNPHVIDNISNWLKINKPSISIISDTYIKNDVDMKWKCHIHNIEFNKQWVEIQQGCYCPKCSTESLINKLTLNQDDVINEFKKIHGDRYDYSKVKYVSAKTPVEIICKIHGSFMMMPDKHKSGQNCKLCGFKDISERQLDSQEEVIKKFKQIHGDTYDYSLVDYINSHTKIIVICKTHGQFLIAPNHHINKKGCKLCSIQNTGWTKTKWIQSALRSKRFNGFKLYVLKCYNDNEVFYKIGRTYLNINQRFSNKYHMPYNYEILHIIENKNGDYIYDLENHLHRLHHVDKLKYTPLIEFGGQYECFKEILDIDKILVDFNNNICNI